MRKTILLLGIMATVLFTACGKEDRIEGIKEETESTETPSETKEEAKETVEEENDEFYIGTYDDSDVEVTDSEKADYVCYYYKGRDSAMTSAGLEEPEHSEPIDKDYNHVKEIEESYLDKLKAIGIEPAKNHMVFREEGEDKDTFYYLIGRSDLDLTYAKENAKAEETGIVKTKDGDITLGYKGHLCENSNFNSREFQTAYFAFRKLLEGRESAALTEEEYEEDDFLCMYPSKEIHVFDEKYYPSEYIDYKKTELSTIYEVEGDELFEKEMQRWDIAYCFMSENIKEAKSQAILATFKANKDYKYIIFFDTFGNQYIMDDKHSINEYEASEEIKAASASLEV